MGIRESINGQTNTSKAWAILRSLLGQHETYNSAARVALREGISAQEPADQAAQVFFPQTSHPTDTTYPMDASSEGSEPPNGLFTMLELEHALQHANEEKDSCNKQAPVAHIHLVREHQLMYDKPNFTAMSRKHHICISTSEPSTLNERERHFFNIERVTWLVKHDFVSVFGERRGARECDAFTVFTGTVAVVIFSATCELKLDIICVTTLPSTLAFIIRVVAQRLRRIRGGRRLIGLN
ncbi:hypothetical protein MTO96_024140 [Rhipicephalus appendiculatus]